MDILIATELLFISLVLMIGLVFLAFICLRLYKPQVQEIVEKKPKKETVENDMYTPDNAVGEVPLESFVPDFTKPINIIRQEESDQITPLEKN